MDLYSVFFNKFKPLIEFDKPKQTKNKTNYQQSCIHLILFGDLNKANFVTKNSLKQ